MLHECMCVLVCKVMGVSVCIVYACMVHHWEGWATEQQEKDNLLWTDRCQLHGVLLLLSCCSFANPGVDTAGTSVQDEAVLKNDNARHKLRFN